MRQVFTSPRFENVERVAQMLEDAGIQTKISNRPGFRHATKRDYSYTGKAPEYTWSAVWVIKADDQPLARKMLREAGLWETERERNEAASLPSYTGIEPAPPAPQRTASRVRIALFVVTLILATYTTLRMAGVL